MDCIWKMLCKLWTFVHLQKLHVTDFVFALSDREFALSDLCFPLSGDRCGCKDFSNCSCSQELEGLEVERVEMIRQHLCQYTTLRHETDMFNQRVSTRLSLNKNPEQLFHLTSEMYLFSVFRNVFLSIQ